MNKVFRVVRRKLGDMVAASECSRSHRGAGRAPGFFTLRIGSLFALAGMVLFAFLALFGLVALLDASAGPMLLALAPVAPGSRTAGWRRLREPAKTFNNVLASATAELKLPRYPRTVYSIDMERNFIDSNQTRIEIFAGETSIWGPVSAAELRMVEKYVNAKTPGGADAAVDPNGTFLRIDFTNPNVKEIGGEQIGGLDLSRYPDTDVRIVTDLGATATPSLKGHMTWGPSMAGSSDPLAGMFRRLVKKTYPAQPAGDFSPILDLKGAILLREYWKGIVYNTAVCTAHTAANAGTVNTGTGACSATVSSLTPAGRYHAICIEPGANVGTFVVYDPNGQYDGTVTVAAGAITLPSGLVVTIADATDFISGDGFFIDVLPVNTDGNLREIQVKKNEQDWYYRTDRMARQEQMRYGRRPLAGLLVADYLTDNHFDSVIDTANAQIDRRIYVTATDTPFVIAEVLQTPPGS